MLCKEIKLGECLEITNEDTGETIEIYVKPRGQKRATLYIKAIKKYKVHLIEVEGEE